MEAEVSDVSALGAREGSSQERVFRICTACATVAKQQSQADFATRKTSTDSLAEL